MFERPVSGKPVRNLALHQLNFLSSSGALNSFLHLIFTQPHSGQSLRLVSSLLNFTPDPWSAGLYCSHQCKWLLLGPYIPSSNFEPAGLGTIGSVTGVHHFLCAGLSSSPDDFWIFRQIGSRALVLNTLLIN